VCAFDPRLLFDANLRRETEAAGASTEVPILRFSVPAALLPTLAQARCC